MAAPVNFPGGISVKEDLRLGGSITPLKAKSKMLAAALLQAFPIPLTSFRVFDAMEGLLPNPGLTDDLGLYYGTHGTDTPSLRTEDHKAVGSAQLNKARVLVQLPWNYIATSAVKLRFMGGMITTVADQAASLDCSVYIQEDDPDDAISADICATAAITVFNSLTFTSHDFTITASALSPGSILDVMITTSVDDDVDTGAVIAAISWAQLLCDVR